jgi:WD40 repeat protein
MKATRVLEESHAQSRLNTRQDTIFVSMCGLMVRKEKMRFPAIAAQVFLGLIVLKLPVMGYCDSPSGWVKSLFESKGKTSKDVAVKVAELPEEYKINVRGLDFSADGKHLAVVSEGEKINIWDWQGKRIVNTLQQTQGAGLAADPVRYSPNARLLVACNSQAASDIAARIWNTDTWEIAHDIVDHAPGGCNAMGFTPDGKSLIRVLDRLPEFPQDTLVIYDTNTWQPVWGLRTAPLHAQALAISPEGNFIALAGYVSGADPVQRQVVIVDMKQRTISRTTQSTIIHSLAWSPDGAHLAVIGSEVQIFDADSGRLMVEEQFAGGGAHKSLRFTPDGKYLIEGDMNGKGTGLGVRIWDGQHRELLQEIPGNVGSLAVSRVPRRWMSARWKGVRPTWA